MTTRGLVDALSEWPGIDLVLEVGLLVGISGFNCVVFILTFGIALSAVDERKDCAVGFGNLYAAESAEGYRETGFALLAEEFFHDLAILYFSSKRD